MGMNQKLQGSTSATKDKEIEEHAELIERELYLVGATAIEDKLQVDVGKLAFYEEGHTEFTPQEKLSAP